MSKKIKKDFDLEQMYRKIMPSIPVGEELPRQEEDPPEPRLHNYMEDMVREKMDHTMKTLNACTCGRCRQDILALTLNQLPAAYAVADPGDTHYLKKLRGAYEVKVTAAIIQAVQQVAKAPRH